MSVPQDGRPTGERGVISAAKIAAGLGLGGPESLKAPEAGDGRPALTPAQARAKAEGKPIPPDAPGFARTVVKGGRDAWEYLGRPATSPIGSAPEGMPIEPEPMSREDEAKLRESRGEVPQRTNWDRIDAERAGRKLAQQVRETRDRLEALLRKEAGA